MADHNRLMVGAAALFVLLWSTGFIGAKFGLPYAEPMTFLALRFALASVALGIWGYLAGEFRGGLDDIGGAIVVGTLIHAIYLGGVFTAIWLGLGAALSALIVGLQPVSTALLSRIMLGERLTIRQWLGMAVGLLGVALVVAKQLSSADANPAGVILCVIGLIAISLASILQKARGVSHRLAADNAVQFAAAAAVMAAGAAALETGEVDWQPEFILALGWMVVALSLGAISLLYILLRHGAVAVTASLFFLVPGVTAMIAWLMFDERFGLVELCGLIGAMIGVRLVTVARTAQTSDQVPGAGDR
ncbi:MAG: DMT family transporter [Pseudomonadota bacterium]